MAHIANEWLEKFEIKKPDYDYIDRDYIGMSDADYVPARYNKIGEQWESKRSRKDYSEKRALE